MMAALFGVDVRTISEYLKNIFVSGALQQNSVVRKSRETASDGKQYLANSYNLDAMKQRRCFRRNLTNGD